MKKVILFVGSVLFFTACSEKPGYEISGTVTNSALNGQYVYLYPLEKDAAALDSALVNNGAFVLKGTQETPVLRTLRFSRELVKPTRVPSGQNAPFSAVFALENAKLNVVLDSVSTVNGTPENDAFTAFQSEVLLVNQELQKLSADFRSEDTAVVAAAEAKYTDLSAKVVDKAKQYITANLGKLTAGKTLYDFRYDLSEDEQNTILEQADSLFKTAPGVDYLIDHLAVLKKVAIGQTFTDFEMTDVKGEVKKLSDYVGQGKYTLIDFWASWCPPCRKEMPNLVALYKQYKNKGFEIVGVSLDSEKDKWEKGIKDLNITWPQLSDLKGWQNEGAAMYGVNSIPHLVLVDKDGTIIAKNLHGEALNDKLKELFQ